MLALAVVATLAAFGCLSSAEHTVVFENRTPDVVRGSFLGSAFSLEPGESQGWQSRRNLMPTHVTAVDEAGVVRFDRTITWDDLKTSGFRVVIE